MRIRSFRVRLLIGSFLWTAGLLFVAHLLSVVFMEHFDVRPHGVRVNHAGGNRAEAENEARRLFLEARRKSFQRGAVVSFFCMAGGLWLVSRGLRSLSELHGRVAALRDGRESRIEGEFPSEVQPVVNDLNALLAHRELQVERAQAKAGDLAHGLKTPLALLAQEAEGVASAGQKALADAITQQVERMRRQIDYHLAQARAVAAGGTFGAHTSLRESAEGIARTLERLQGSRAIEIRVAIDAEHQTRVERQDLDEMLGNLLENACRWARAQVTVSSGLQGVFVIIDVDDDGPGIEPSMREAVLRRGVRADEAGPGWGLGLAIVRDLAEVYGGAIALDVAPGGGLRARLTLPT